MSMRKQFVKTVETILSQNENVTLLLGDIGVFGFQKAFKDFPDRVYNIGILEQATVGVASGLAKSDFIPIVHTIAPFLVERTFEQLKIDFGYQRLGGNFVSAGASYDYASLGCTHHCPGDVGLLSNIPGMEIVIPGTASEFDMLFSEAYANGNPTYFRLSERENEISQPVEFGKACVLKKGGLATVVAIGPTLSWVLDAVEGLDVGVIYYTVIAPFDSDTLSTNLSSSGKILLVEPFYAGTITHAVSQSVWPKSVSIDSIGIPREFLSNYGSVAEHDRSIGFTPENIRARLEVLIHG